MALIKVIFILAITMALSIALTMNTFGKAEEKPPIKQRNDVSSKGFEVEAEKNNPVLPPKRMSRFLFEDKNPRAADHCHKDYERCYYEVGKNSTCCNNKCVFLQEDDHNCGACKNKCKFTQTCCRGQCVYLSYDKRHCGQCNHRCEKGQYCVSGLCDYA
ncbi:hypothetical protein Tsubulata_017472 [Turnera subulata]|uniref:Stigma-specific STIG1-like protein 1 n=1 Tax=Turnera subulata TaxID=218843 RepID=A0A9Q0FFS1_9ROSI|nr:hypothetical protein Tsubulata_017472 [Turnera subulata]